MSGNVNVSNNIVNSTILWDRATIDVISMVAEGLLNLTQLFSAQNINIIGIKVKNEVVDREEEQEKPVSEDVTMEEELISNL